jgi:hypothetical protein
MDIPHLIQRYIGLFLGIFMLCMAGVAAITGEVRGRFGGVTYRDQDRKVFWNSVAIYCLLGTGFMLAFVCKIHASSN